MCGLVGICFQGRMRSAAEELVVELMQLLRHRGPDDEGMY